MSKGTDRRTVRVAPELWERAGRVAASNDETLSDVIRRALERYAPATKSLSQLSIDAHTRQLREPGAHNE